MRDGKGFTLFISNEDVGYIIKIIKSLEVSNGLIDGITETVKNEIEKEEGRYIPTLLAPLAASLVQPVISSVIKRISERGIIYYKEIIINYELRFNDVFSRKNLCRRKDGVYLINLNN